MGWLKRTKIKCETSNEPGLRVIHEGGEYREIAIQQKTMYISKSNDLYVQCNKDVDPRLFENVSFILGTTIRVHGKVSRITANGFYVTDWTMKNERFDDDI